MCQLNWMGLQEELALLDLGTVTVDVTGNGEGSRFYIKCEVCAGNGSQIVYNRRFKMRMRRTEQPLLLLIDTG